MRMFERYYNATVWFEINTNGCIWRPFFNWARQEEPNISIEYCLETNTTVAGGHPSPPPLSLSSFSVELISLISNHNVTNHLVKARLQKTISAFYSNSYSLTLPFKN